MYKQLAPLTVVLRSQTSVRESGCVRLQYFKVEVPTVREAVSLHEQASSSVHQQQPSEQTDVGGDASTFTDPLDESDSGTPLSINVSIVTFDANDYYT